MKRFHAIFYAVIFLFLTVNSLWACPSGMETIPSLKESSSCYGLFHSFQGAFQKVKQTQARFICLMYFEGAHLVLPKSKSQMLAIVNWAKSKGLQDQEESGIWTNYKRTQYAPLDPDGSLSPETVQIRRNRRLFLDGLPAGGSVMPDELWRDESQPGSPMDDRDEQCVAQSFPGNIENHLGLDDYECEGKELHYLICER